MYIENDLTIKGLWWSKDNGGYETSLHIANGKTFTVEDYLGFGDKPSNTNNLVYDGTGTFIYTCNGLSYEISSISDITGNVEFEPSGDNGFTVNGTLITDQASYSVNGITLTKLN